MLEKLVPYSQDQIKGFLEEFTQGHESQEAWANTMLKGWAELLKKQPYEYLEFSCFWWPVKKAMIEAGLMVGEVDQDLVDQATTGSFVGDIAAAFAMTQARLYMGVNGRTMMLEDEYGEPFEYTLGDM